MEYLVVFLEGVITFISPCILPMLPVYISYFAGGKEQDSKKTLINALGFVLGFMIVFVMLGALAGTVGSFFARHRTAVNVVCGLIVVLFGLNFLGVFKFNIFKGGNSDVKTDDLGFLSSIVFGMVFSISWTPCVGVFLGSALMVASQQGRALEGALMLLLYSLGLGIPFIISAMLIDRLKSTFDWVKSHYGVINIVCGVLLIIVGLLMATGMLGKALSFIAMR